MTRIQVSDPGPNVPFVILRGRRLWLPCCYVLLSLKIEFVFANRTNLYVQLGGNSSGSSLFAKVTIPFFPLYKGLIILRI